MKHALETITGIRPTADLTIANYIGAIKPVLDLETSNPGADTAVFIAELHAATTHPPSEVVPNAHELARTLIASGVQGHIYSQRRIQGIVLEAQQAVQGLVTVSRLLHLPTLKEKYTQSDNPAGATVGLVMYPTLMAADIIVSRPAYVPTGKDQRPHLEITNQVIRHFNSAYNAELPHIDIREVEPVNVLSLDASGRKMSKTSPRGAVFLDQPPAIGGRKIRRAVNAPAPGSTLDTIVNNMLTIAAGLSAEPLKSEVTDLADRVKAGEPHMGNLKTFVGDIVVNFLTEIQERRASVSDAEIHDRIAAGSEYMSEIGEQTIAYMRQMTWGD